MEIVHSEFAEIPDQRRANAKYELTDFLSSAFAMFSLKSPSLLAFEQRAKAADHNLESIYHIKAIPSDTQMRTALDPIDPAPPAGIVRHALCHLAARGRG